MIFNEKIKEHYLDNGLKILFQHHQGTSSATFMVWYKVGAGDEKDCNTGLSHFLEHLSFKETEMFKKGQIVSEITRNGGIFNAYTGKDFTCYYETFATCRLELAMLIEAQRMQSLVLDENDRKIEVGIILSEIEKGLDNPYTAIGNEMRKYAYPDNPYGHPIVGYEEDVKNTTIEDLKEHYKKYYVPNNAVIVLTGNFDENQALHLIKKHFGHIPHSKENINHNQREFKFQNGLTRVKVEKNGPSPIVKLAYHIPATSHPDIYPLTVLAEMLNIGMSSRFYKSMVETRISTDINVSAELLKHPGLFTILCTLYPDVCHNVAEEAIFEQIESLKTFNTPTIEELEKTKKRIKSTFEFNKDGTFKLAYLLGYYETINAPDFIENYIENIEKVCIEDIVRVTKQYLTKDNCILGNFIPTKTESKIVTQSTNYEPEVHIHNEYSAPPIILTEKIKNQPLSFKKKTLSNGIKLIVCENKTNDTVRLYGCLTAGNVYSSIVNPVLPVMCGGMLNRGTKHMTKLEIAEIIESRGASTGISNVGESVNFTLSSLSIDFPVILNILADILTRPSFPEEEYEKYKKYALASLKQKENHSGYISMSEFTRQIYPKGHIYYSYSLEEQEKQINDVTLDDIIEFYNVYYSPKDVIIAISGNINSDEVFNLFEKTFSHWKNKIVPEPNLLTVDLVSEFVEKNIFISGKTETEVIFGHYGGLSKQNPDYHAATVMNFILGGGGALSSRLGRRIRQDLGLVYNISSSFNSQKVPGSWSVKYAVDNRHLELSLQALRECIIDFINNGVTQEELDNAKSYIIGSHPLKLSSNTGIARTLLANEYFELEDDYIEKYPDIIEKLTLDDVNYAAKKYLQPDKAVVIKVGSF